MSDNTIHVSIDGKKFSGWTDVTITKSLETLCSSFSMGATDIDNQKSNAEWLLQVQDECIIYIGNERLITGYIDRVNADVAEDMHNIKLSGRDKTADLVDCSHASSKKSFSKMTMLSLATELVQPFGLKASLGTGVVATDRFQFTVNTNDSIFKNLNKKAQDFGLLLLSDVKGNLVISNSGDRTLDEILEYGRNIKFCNVSFDYTNRFKDYTVHAQSLSKQGKGNWAKFITVKATASDSGINRYRPKVFRNTSPLTRAAAQENAKWEALIRSARSQVVTVTVQGFRDSNGLLWDVNKLVEVKIPPLYINPTMEMLITAVEFSLSENGSTTKLTLKRPDAYTAKPYRKKSVKVFNSLGWDKLKQVRKS